MVILTATGPVSDVDGLISLFEFPSTDLSSTALSSATLDPVSMWNRVTALEIPRKFHDSLAFSKEDIVQEIEQAGLALVGSLSEIPKTRTPCVFSSTLPTAHVSMSPREKIAWLTTSVSLGRDGIYFGMLGPVTKLDEAEIFLQAHQETGAPLVFRLDTAAEINDVIDKMEKGNFATQGICLLNTPSEVVTLVLEKTNAFLGFTCPCLENEIIRNPFPSASIAGVSPSAVLGFLAQVPPHRLLVSTGIFLKPHLRKFGGVGIRLAADILGMYAAGVMGTNARRFLSFDWKTPELTRIVQKKIWTCHVCGKQDTEDVRNYSKMGFTYCSMGCLGKHRALGFA